MATQEDLTRQKTIHKVDDVPERQADNYVSTYANLVEISARPWDFRVSFFEVVEDEDGNQIREKKAAVTMSPRSIETFVRILNQALRDWIAEQQKIEDDEAGTG